MSYVCYGINGTPFAIYIELQLFWCFIYCYILCCPLALWRNSQFRDILILRKNLGLWYSSRLSNMVHKCIILGWFFTLDDNVVWKPGSPCELLTRLQVSAHRHECQQQIFYSSPPIGFSFIIRWHVSDYYFSISFLCGNYYNTFNYMYIKLEYDFVHSSREHKG